MNNIEKHIIAYVDEQNKEIRNFKRQTYKTLNVLGFLPKKDLNEFVEELLESGVEAIVADFRLNEYRDDVKEPINYTGSELIEKVLERKKDFPCFVLTSFDDHAASETRDVNYVYSKEILKSEGKITFAEKIRLQIEHYQSMLKEKDDRFHELLEKSEKQELSEEEENELLKLDSYLESAIDDRASLPKEKKDRLAFGKIEDLIESTNELLHKLKKEKE